MIFTMARKQTRRTGDVWVGVAVRWFTVVVRQLTHSYSPQRLLMHIRLWWKWGIRRQRTMIIMMMMMMLMFCNGTENSFDQHTAYRRGRYIISIRWMRLMYIQIFAILFASIWRNGVNGVCVTTDSLGNRTAPDRGGLQIECSSLIYGCVCEFALRSKMLLHCDGFRSFPHFPTILPASKGLCSRLAYTL